MIKSLYNIILIILLSYGSTYAYSTTSPKDSLIVFREISLLGNISKKENHSDNFSLLKEREGDENTKHTEIAIERFKEVEEKGNFTDKLTPNDLTELPVGIRETKNSVEYGIVVTKATFTPKYAIVDVYARVRTPQQGLEGGRKDLYFGAEGIKLSYGGRVIGDTKLTLLGDMHIPFNNNQWLLTLEGGDINKENGTTENSNTYVTIDCEGIKEMSLKGNIQISRNIVVPIDSETGELAPEFISQGTKNITNRVRGDFFIKASDWNDLLVEINISPFAITSQVKDTDRGYFTFTANNAILDLSDFRNNPEVIFPKYYSENNYFIGGEQSWRGLFVKSLKLGLPAEFKTTDRSDRPIVLQANNLIVDNYGVSGSFSAQNVFDIDKGITSRENAWRYSLDEIGVELASSHIVGANIAGRIQLPIQKDKSSSLVYRGVMTEDDYLMSVEMQDAVDFDVWRAKATIEQGSSIEMNVKNRRFYPKAILNGTLDISANRDKDDLGEKRLLTLKGINFQELTLQTESPFFSVGRLSVTGEQKLSGFPISIKDINLVTNNNRVDLGLGISVGLQDRAFAASGNIMIKGEVEKDRYYQNWSYKGFDISTLKLENVDIGLATVNGTLELMNNNPLYGNGFRSALDVKIAKLSGLQVKTNAIFGYSTFRYWGFEGTVDGLNIPTGVLQITGFTGGAFYRMIPDIDKTSDKRYSDHAFVLKPDKEVGLALRAGVYGAVKDKNVTSIMAGFNMSTNANGGLSNIGLVGEAYIMQDLTVFIPNPMVKVQEKFKKMINNRKFLADVSNNKRINSYLDINKVDNYYPASVTQKDATITAKMAMNYDFNNSTFHADLEVYVNTPGGFIQGTGDRGRAGWAVLHIDPKDWYLYIGTPTNMIGLKMGVANLRLQSDNYFMVGTRIPGSPPPPSRVVNILGTQLNDIDYMKDLNNLSQGKGFAFGSHFSFDTGDMTALFLYARFMAGYGGDIMLRNYGEAQCSNRSGGQIGINGWYANGQAYAYLQGELGIKIKLFFINKKIAIIRNGTAALLQVKGPNPFWMRGYVGGEYRLLGGLINGSYRFKVEFGEECKLANESVLGGMKIITDVTPRKGDTDTDVFTIPQATLAFKVNKPIVIPEDDGDHTYKIIVDKFTIEKNDGTEIKGRIEYGKSSDVVNFVSEDILPPNEKLKVLLEVSFLEKKDGLYQVLMVDGKKATEKEEREFTTGTAPNHIPLRNIEYAYPVVNQHNYYKKESNKGYIKLERGQDYLFDDPNWKTFVEFTQNGQTKTVDFFYNTKDNEVHFTTPNLSNGKEYKMGIIARNDNLSVGDDQVSIVVKSDVVSEGKDDSEVSTNIKTKKAKKTSKEGEIERLSYVFRTSNYNTFTEKINRQNFSGNTGYISSGVYFLQNNMNSDEYFETIELVGNKYTKDKPLIEVTALMDDPYGLKFRKLFYDNYPIEGITLDRAGDKIGIPPVKALPIIPSYLIYLEKENWKPELKEIFPYQYDLFRYYSNDWYRIKTKAMIKYTSEANISNAVRAILSSEYTNIPSGSYRVRAQYIMPGGKKGTEAIVNYKKKN